MRRLALHAILTIVALLVPAVSLPQGSTETVDGPAMQDIPVEVVDLSVVDFSCVVWISHSRWRFDVSQDESSVDITCVFAVEVENDRKIERRRVEECRSKLKKRNHCWGNDSQDFLRKARKADFTVSYEENFDGGEDGAPAASGVTMIVHAQIDLEQ